MLTALFADRLIVGTWGIGEVLIAIVILAGACAIVYLVTRAMGVTIPPWFVQVLWVVLAVVVGVVAIRFLMTL